MDKHTMNESQTLIKLGPLPEIVGENSTAFHPYEARQQLGCPLFLLDEWAPPYKATPKMGCWNQIHKMRRVTFCLTIFSSPDNKHNIALSSNYDLRMLHNTKHMIFFPSYVLIVLVMLQMMRPWDEGNGNSDMYCICMCEVFSSLFSSLMS